MKDKYITLFIIPHYRGRQKTISISRRTYKYMRVIIPTVFMALALFIVDYVMMNGTRQEYKRLKQDYAQQTQLLSQYKESIDDLQATIEDFNQYRQKLNVMAGLKAEEPMEEDPGIGGPMDYQETAPSQTAQGLSRLQEISQKADGIQDNLQTLANFFEDQVDVLAQTPSIMPTQGYMVSGFKYRTDPFTGQRAFHPGLDIATQYGNPIYATADGIILQTKNDKVGGKTVKISHPKTGYVTVYCHMSKFLVKPGQRVKRGETIGLIGRTGRARGPHVHYEVRLKGRRYNPWNFILDN